MFQEDEETAQQWLVNNFKVEILWHQLGFEILYNKSVMKTKKKHNIAYWIIRELNNQSSLRTAQQLLMNFERVENHKSTEIFEGLDNMSLKKKIKQHNIDSWIFWEWNNFEDGKLWGTRQHKVQRKWWDGKTLACKHYRIKIDLLDFEVLHNKGPEKNLNSTTLAHE